MGISLLSPMYLLGLALLGLPLIIHLMSRRRVTEREFSDIRFIREAITRRQKEIQLEERRLMALRMALIGLLALALAKPVLKTSPTAVARSGEKSSVVFVVDTSFSMATSDNGVVRMDRAAAKIRSLLSFYGTGDEVSLIAASERPEVLVKRVDASVREVAAEAEGLEPSFLTSDLAGGLRLALTVLQPVEDKKREIYLITDMQALAWEQVAFRKDEMGKLDTDLFLVNVGSSEQWNLAITAGRVESVEKDEHENLEEVMVTFQIESFGRTSEEPAVLREVVGGREEASVALRPRTDAAIEQTFTNWVRQAGPVSGYGELGHDPLQVDNRRFFVHGGGGQRSILLLEGNPADEAEDQGRPEGFFLSKAVEVLQSGLSLHLRQAEAGDQLDRVDFAAYQLVILVDVPMMTERSALALRRYIEEGGRVIMYLGPRIRPEHYNSTLYPELVPFRLDPDPKAPSEADRITRRLPDHPLFRLFNEENIDFSEASFAAHWRLKPEDGSPARPLAWYSTGDIAIVEAQIAAGSVMVFTSSPGPPWNDLPSHLPFVPFVGEVVKYLLAEDPQQTSLSVGDTIALQVVSEEEIWDHTTSVLVSHPSGETETLAATLASGSGRLFFNNLNQPGVYRFAWSGSGPKVRVSPEVVAVNPNTAESDLGFIDAAAALERLSAFRTEAVETNALETAISRARRGRPVWDYLLLVVLGLLVAETIYGNRVRRAGPPKD